MPQIAVLIVMGVSGAGKTTVGKLLAQELGWTFADADDFHSASNKAKMHAGVALTDSDRAPWLEALAEAVAEALNKPQGLVLACSALRENYRDILESRLDPAQKSAVRFVYLRADFDAIAERLNNRRDHFMNKNLLQSQFQTLEEPHGAMLVDARATPDKIVEEITARLAVLDS